MQEIIERILEGNFDYENGSLDFSCAKIEITMQKGYVYEGSFVISTSHGQLATGYIHTSDDRMECLTPEFAGKEAEVLFRFHGEGLEEGDVVKGAFLVISNQGEYYLPFVVSMEHGILESSIGNIKNLFHFANLAKSNWAEAVKLFYTAEFERVFRGSDAQFFDSYRALSAHPGNEQNVDEFLTRIHKKQLIAFAVEEPQINLEISAMESPYGVTETVLNIVRNGWGYTFLQIECEGEFLYIEKESLTDDDFLGNYCRLPVYVDTSQCRRGKNFGTIYLYNSYISLEIPVMVRLGQGNVKNIRRSRKQTIVQLMEYYQAFRMKKIGTSVWLKETGKLIEGLVAISERDVPARLFQAQVLITEERYNEAGWLLDHAADLMEQDEQVDSALWAYYLYLTTLINSEEEYMEQVAASVERIYRQNRSDWRVAWLLLYLSEEYNRSASAKWSFLEKQFRYGCNSPIIYIEALTLINNNPALLRKLNRLELQVLHFGAKWEIVSEGAVEQLLYLAARVKEYNPLLRDILERLYQKRPDKRLLQEICTLLIKGGRVGRAYFKWYEAGIEAQLRITNLYEYYMLSLDREQVQVIPKIVLMYFSYQNHLDYEHTAFLYHYVWQHREEYEEIYLSYRPRMERFLAEQIQKRHINRYLAALYQELITPGMLTEQSAEAMAQLVFAHQIRVKDRRMCKVFVYHANNLYPEEYALQGDNTWVAIYGNDYTIAFEDAWGNRFVENVEYTLEKLMLHGKYLKQLAHYVKGTLGLDILLCLEEKGEDSLTEERQERYKRVMQSVRVENSLRRDVYMRLLKLYYDADDMRALEDGLESVPDCELTAEDRGNILRYMVLCGKYQRAYQWLELYGFHFVDAKVLMRLVSEMIQGVHFVKEALLLEAARYVFHMGKYDSTILEYLVRYYEGMTKNMRDVWKAARAFEVDCYALSEKILLQMLYSGAFVGEKMEIFRYYLSQGAKQEVAEAVLAQCCYEYFVKEKLTEESVFQEIANAYRRGEAIRKVCKLAFLKYYAESREYKREPVMPMIEEFLRDMMKEGIHLNFFREYREWGTLCREMADKTIIEYRANPKARARIYYVVVYENGECGEYLSEYMQEVYGGVCFKEFVLFFGETLQYYIMEESDEDAQLTHSDNVQKSDIINDPVRSSYELINDIIISKALQDFDTLDNMLEEYYRREYLNSRLFVLE